MALCGDEHGARWGSHTGPPGVEEGPVENAECSDRSRAPAENDHRGSAFAGTSGRNNTENVYQIFTELTSILSITKIFEKECQLREKLKKKTVFGPIQKIKKIVGKN